MSERRLEGRVALVTGGARRTGRAISLALAEQPSSAASDGPEQQQEMEQQQQVPVGAAEAAEATRARWLPWRFL